MPYIRVGLGEQQGLGEATRLAAGGVSIVEIQRQGRWRSDAFIMYVRATREKEDKV